MIIVLVFICSLVCNLISTREIYCISRVQPIRAALLAGLSSSLSFVVTILIVIELNRWSLALPYVIGDMIGTWVALHKDR